MTESGKLYAICALADMVHQFGYRTTFRKQMAVCDGGLSALEDAFYALKQCGCPMNSNGTITLKKLWGFSEKVSDIANQKLEEEIANER